MSVSLEVMGTSHVIDNSILICMCLRSHFSSMSILFFSFHSSAPTKTLCRSMEDLNRSAAFKDKQKEQGLPRAHFSTTPLTSSSTLPGRDFITPGYLMHRSRSSSNLPQNPYMEMHITSPNPPVVTKSYSQWDVASTTYKHTDGNIKVTQTLPHVCRHN